MDMTFINYGHLSIMDINLLITKNIIIYLYNMHLHIDIKLGII